MRQNINNILQNELKVTLRLEINVQSVSEHQKRFPLLGNSLEKDFQGTLRSKINVLSVSIWHFWLSCIFWQSFEIGKIKKVCQMKCFRKWFWSYFVFGNECAKLMCNFFEWFSWNLFLELRSIALKTNQSKLFTWQEF